MSQAATSPGPAATATVAVTHLAARPPFDFDHSLSFLTAFPAMTGEHGVSGGTLSRALRERGRLVGVQLSLADPADGVGLRCVLAADAPLSGEETAAIEDRLRFFLGLDDDLEPFYRLARGDAPFQPVLARLHGYHQVKFPSPFELLCWAILGQRIPMPVARTMKQALVEAVGNRLVLNGTEQWAFPEVDQLLALSEADLVSLVRNQRKARYLYAAFRHWRDIDETFLRTGPYDEVRERLLQIPGIGPWSASFLLIRGLGRMEHIAPDREILRAASRVYGHDIGAPEFGELAGRYGVWQGYWAHYLRVAA